jgi:alkylhydroperoxidase/carboxymuconolactone decarboxylase family protein YurZ
MVRIRPLSIDDVPPPSRRHFEGDKTLFGEALNSTRALAHCPRILDAAKAMGSGVMRSGHLSEELRCLINIKAAAMLGCPF